MRRVAASLLASSERFTELDQALGDGDLGVTVAKVAGALRSHASSEGSEDIGKFLAAAGMAVNRAAPSTMGTLLATALLRAGKEATGRSELKDQDIAAMLRAATQGIQERGKASLGDKTIVDALHPSASAFAETLAEGGDRTAAAEHALEAAVAGRDAVTPKRSRVGRAGWVGERTEGKVDPGCEVWVTILTALVGREGPA